MADKIISFLSGNNIPYSTKNGLTSFELKNQEEKITIYYNGQRFFIDKKDYKYQPHIITHWNLNKDKNKYGLCLTMDGSDRRDNELNPDGKIKRIKEIVFELWDDPVSERFRELNVLLQTIDSKELFINESGEICSIKTSDKFNIKKITIEFRGENKKDFIKMKHKNVIHDEWLLIKTIYKNLVKKVLVSPKNNFYKLNDFSEDSFWSRTGKIKISKKIILVGLGSIGGLVLDFLCKSGFQDIVIFDDDKMDVANNTRHIYGIKAFEIGISKIEHMTNHYSKLYPMTKIKSFNEKYKYDKKIDEETIVVNTTGGSHSELLNKYIKTFKRNESLKVTIVDLSIEPYALAIHGIVLNYWEDSKYKNTFNFFNNDRYLVTNKKDFRKNFDGCFTPTLPYNFTPLQIGVPWLLTEMIKDKFVNSHYTIPFLSLFPNKKSIINKELSKKIDPYRIGVKLWKR